MKILILGIDGYLGWPLALHLAERGHVIAGMDNFARRQWVEEMGSVSAIPIASALDRLYGFRDRFNCELHPYPYSYDMMIYETLCEVLSITKPHVIVHLAECPSASYSMSSPKRAAFVMQNNVIGTLNLLHAMRDRAPKAHLVKLGTMGEYGTPNLDIPEGFFAPDMICKDGVWRVADLPFPRKAGSWYHWSKVHDSMNVMFACETWGLRSTDIMQGVVYGTRIDAMGEDKRLKTRLDFDECFGTVINRFVCQALVGHPLTIYGDVGKQTRGFLPLRDSMQCLTLAIDNPPEDGEYRVFNQFEDTYSVLDLAAFVQLVGARKGLEVEIGHYEMPRAEMQEHYYSPDHTNLLQLGYVPTSDMKSELSHMFEDLSPHVDRIRDHADVLIPEVRWTGEIEKVRRIK